MWRSRPRPHTLSPFGERMAAAALAAIVIGAVYGWIILDAMTNGGVP